MKEQPEFPVLALLASRGLLAPDTWKCKQAQVSLKAIDAPPGCTRCPRPTGQTADAGTIIGQNDIRGAVAAIADLPSPMLLDTPFVLALGTPGAQNVPPKTGTLAHRALEEWERTLCENKAWLGDPGFLH